MLEVIDTVGRYVNYHIQNPKDAELLKKRISSFPMGGAVVRSVSKSKLIGELSAIGSLRTLIIGEGLSINNQS